MRANWPADVRGQGRLKLQIGFALFRRAFCKIRAVRRTRQPFRRLVQKPCRIALRIVQNFAARRTIAPDGEQRPKRSVLVRVPAEPLWVRSHISLPHQWASVVVKQVPVADLTPVKGSTAAAAS